MATTRMIFNDARARRSWATPPGPPPRPSCARRVGTPRTAMSPRSDWRGSTGEMAPGHREDGRSPAGSAATRARSNLRSAVSCSTDPARPDRGAGPAAASTARRPRSRRSSAPSPPRSSRAAARRPARRRPRPAGPPRSRPPRPPRPRPWVSPGRRSFVPGWLPCRPAPRPAGDRGRERGLAEDGPGRLPELRERPGSAAHRGSGRHFVVVEPGPSLGPLRALPGHESSTFPEPATRGRCRGRLSLSWLADMTAGLSLTVGLSDPIVLGWGMGGQIALSLAERHPGLIASLILVDTSAGGPGSVRLRAKSSACSRGRAPRRWRCRRSCFRPRPSDCRIG